MQRGDSRRGRPWQPTSTSSTPPVRTRARRCARTQGDAHDLPALRPNPQPFFELVRAASGYPAGTAHIEYRFYTIELQAAVSVLSGLQNNMSLCAVVSRSAAHCGPCQVWRGRGGGAAPGVQPLTSSSPSCMSRRCCVAARVNVRVGEQASTRSSRSSCSTVRLLRQPRHPSRQPGSGWLLL